MMFFFLKTEIPQVCIKGEFVDSHLSSHRSWTGKWERGKKKKKNEKLGVGYYPRCKITKQEMKMLCSNKCKWGSQLYYFRNTKPNTWTFKYQTSIHDFHCWVILVILTLLTHNSGGVRLNLSRQTFHLWSL